MIHVSKSVLKMLKTTITTSKTGGTDNKTQLYNIIMLSLLFQLLRYIITVYITQLKSTEYNISLYSNMLTMLISVMPVSVVNIKRN